MPNPMREAKDARKRAAAAAPDEYAIFVHVAKFMKRVEIHYSEAEDTYSAKDKKTCDEFISRYGEGIMARFAKSHPVHGRMDFVRPKETRFTNPTEFAFEVYKCLTELDATRRR